MSNDKMNLVDDAGEYVPDARKHNAEKTGKQSDAEVTLSDLWPEPNWKALVADGMSAELAAWKFIAYNSIRTKPREWFVNNLKGSQWADAYRTAVALLREIIEGASDIEELQQIDSALCKKIGIVKEHLPTLGVEKCIVFWAAGLGGNKRLKAPGTGTTRLRTMRPWLAKMGWPHSDAVWQASIVPVELTDGRWVVGKIEGEALYSDSGATFLREEEALEAAIKAAEREVALKQNATKLVPRRPTADKDMKRIGPDHRNGADITPEQLMAEFNLRAIQYGNSVTIKDRQLWINQTFDALSDLADVLKMKRKWLGLSFEGRSLALAIGARGTSSAAAHYEPDHKIINQTYSSGAGALAHELAHALDHRLGNTLGLARYATIYALGIEQNYTGPDEKARSIGEQFFQIGLLIEGSNFLKAARKISTTHRAGRYWTDAQELFARSFEAYVQDALTAMGRVNPWLVHGTMEDDYDLTSVVAFPYPVGVERQAFFDAYRLLVETMLA